MYVEMVSSRPDRDGRAGRRLESGEKTAAGKITGLVIVDSYRFDTADFPEGGERGLLCDPIAQRSYRNRHAALDPSNAGWFLLAEITYRPGVTNPEAITLRNALESFLGRPIPLETAVQTARQYLFHGTPLSDAERERLVGVLYNPLIEPATTAVPADFENGDPLPLYYPAAGIAGNAGTATVAGGKSGQAGILAAGGSAAEASLPGPAPPAVLRFPVASMTAAELASLSSERLLALDAREMKAIRDYYRSPEVIAARKRAGLPPEATDVEIEMIAQTWSEHCKHKIFRARITYTEEPAAGGGSRAAVGTDGGQPAAGTGGAETIDSLFSTYIKATTKQLTEEKGYLRSVFDDNSGVVDFDGENLLCFKVETHNSPSALDPYGGAKIGRAHV